LNGLEEPLKNKVVLTIAIKADSFPDILKCISNSINMSDSVNSEFLCAPDAVFSPELRQITTKK
jgi:hypothetical protein